MTVFRRRAPFRYDEIYAECQPQNPENTDAALIRMERLLRHRKGKTIKDLSVLLDIAEDDCREQLRQLLGIGAMIRADRNQKMDEFRFQLIGYNTRAHDHHHYPGLSSKTSTTHAEQH